MGDNYECKHEYKIKGDYMQDEWYKGYVKRRENEQKSFPIVAPAPRRTPSMAEAIDILSQKGFKIIAPEN